MSTQREREEEASLSTLTHTCSLVCPEAPAVAVGSTRVGATDVPATMGTWDCTQPRPTQANHFLLSQPPMLTLSWSSQAGVETRLCAHLGCGPGALHAASPVCAALDATVWPSLATAVATSLLPLLGPVVLASV